MSHQKCADNALSALKMPKNVKFWKANDSNTQMHAGRFTNGDSQDLYLPDGHFKGMAQILIEQGFLNALQLLGQCKGFKCSDISPTAQYCCCHILFNQPDFQSQKEHLQELIELRIPSHFLL